MVWDESVICHACKQYLLLWKTVTPVKQLEIAKKKLQTVGSGRAGEHTCKQSTDFRDKQHEIGVTAVREGLGGSLQCAAAKEKLRQWLYHDKRLMDSTHWEVFFDCKGLTPYTSCSFRSSMCRCTCTCGMMSNLAIQRFPISSFSNSPLPIPCIHFLSRQFYIFLIPGMYMQLNMHIWHVLPIAGVSNFPLSD